MIASAALIAAPTAAAPPGASRPAARAGGGFGEAWDAARSTPEVSRSAQQPAVARQGPPDDGRPAPAAEQDGEKALAKSTPKRGKGAAATAAIAVAADPIPPAPAPTPDLVALQAAIAAMTGGAPASARAAAPATGAAMSDAGERAVASSSAEGSLLSTLDPGVLPFTLDPRFTTALADADATATATAALPTDPVVTHHLDLAGDGAWLDQLTRDIAQSADANGQLRFGLQPERLGRLEVQLSQGAEGTAIRLTTETRDAHRIVADAQPQLVAEARAQGLRITEAHVHLHDRGHGGGSHQSFGNQNSGGRSQPQPIEVATGPDATAPVALDDPGPADALYA